MKIYDDDDEISTLKIYALRPYGASPFIFLKSFLGMAVAYLQLFICFKYITISFKATLNIGL